MKRNEFGGTVVLMKMKNIYKVLVGISDITYET
jgi:hypothetical protein